MTEYNKDEVALWKNDNRQSDRHPHYKGSATVNGVEYWASAWVNKSDNERAPLMKISLNVKEQAPTKPAPPKVDVDFDLDDDLPF